MSADALLRSRRWLVATAATAAIVPLPALAQLKGKDDDETGSGDENSYTSPGYGMEVTWEAPWQLDDTTERADIGYEMATLGLDGVPGDYLTLTTSLVSANFDSAEEYLDHYEESYGPAKIEALRDHTDGVHYLIQERTDSTLTVMFYFETNGGATFEMYEHRAESGDDHATWTILIVNSVEVFEGNFKGVQQYVTLNGDAPFLTVNERDVVSLANDALDGIYPDDSGSGSSTQEDDNEDPQEDDTDTNDDADAVLQDVRDHFDELRSAMDEFTGLFTQTLTDAEADRLNEIIGLWLDAPGIAADAGLTSRQSDLEDAYLAYTQNLALAANGLITAVSDESSETVAAAGAQQFEDAIAADSDLAARLDGLLTEYGV